MLVDGGYPEMSARRWLEAGRSLEKVSVRASLVLDVHSGPRDLEGMQCRCAREPKSRRPKVCMRSGKSWREEEKISSTRPHYIIRTKKRKLFKAKSQGFP